MSTILKNRLIQRSGVQLRDASQSGLKLFTEDLKAIAESVGLRSEIILDEFQTDSFPDPDESMNFSDWLEVTDWRLQGRIYLDDSSYWAIEITYRTGSGYESGYRVGYFRINEENPRTKNVYDYRYRTIPKYFAEINDQYSDELYLIYGTTNTTSNGAVSYSFFISDYAAIFGLLFYDEQVTVYSDDMVLSTFFSIVQTNLDETMPCMVSYNQKHGDLDIEGRTSLDSWYDGTYPKITFFTSQGFFHSYPISIKPIFWRQELLVSLVPIHSLNGEVLAPYIYCKYHGQGSFFGHIELHTPEGQKSFYVVSNLCIKVKEEE